MSIIMTSSLLFLLFITMGDVSLGAPADTKNKTDDIMKRTEDGPKPKANFKPSVLYDDILVPSTLSRNADPCTSRGCKWPKTGQYVNVPYYISSHYSQEERNIITRGMMSFHQSTCIRFIPWNSGHRNYIYFISNPESGCMSSLGRQRGGQYIYLEKNYCVYHSTVQHEILHALGFNHEQVRSDRDQYVQILYQNIKPGQVYNFMKKDTYNLGTPYDFNSVMHYRKYAFSINGEPTIVAKGNYYYDWGSANQMSANDIARVNMLYRCRL